MPRPRNSFPRSALLLLIACFAAASCDDAVAPTPLAVTRVVIEPRTFEVTVGDTIRLTATAYSGAQQVQNADVRWMTSDSALASIDASGLMRVKASGTVRITASVQKITSSVSIVIPAVLAPVIGAPGIDSAQARIASTGANTCALSGTRAYCWGTNHSGTTLLTAHGFVRLGGVLGVADTTNDVRTPSPLKGDFNMKSLAAGSGYFRCGVTTEHKAVCWGYTDWGTTNTPAVTNTQLSFSSVAVGYKHVCGVSVDGLVYCWGDLASGITASAQPVAIADSVVAVAAGMNRTCALGKEAAVYCWSRTEPGVVKGTVPFSRIDGYGSFKYSDRFCGLTRHGIPYCWRDDASLPVKVSTPHQFVTLSVGAGQICGITTNTQTYCWAPDGAPDGSPITAPSRFTAVAAGADASCAIGLDRNAYCWGTREGGQLGDGYSWLRPFGPVAGNNTFTRISGARELQCALTASGQAYCWGANGLGLMGSGTIATSPTHIPAPVRFRDLAVADRNVCFLDETGAAWCTGMPYGFGAPQRINAPVAFSTITLGTDHACGIAVDGAAYCWGGNAKGQLGAGDFTASPAVMPRAVSGDLRFRDISASEGFTCGVTTSGSVYCWGEELFGRMGNAVLDARCGGSSKPVIEPIPCTSSPKLISGVSNAREIETTEIHACTLTTNAEAFCWGGIGGPETCYTVLWIPVGCHKTPALVATRAMRDLHSLPYEITAVGDDGQVYRSRSVTEPFVAMQFGIPLTTYAGICGLSREGVAYCGGYNGSGAVGDGIPPYSSTPVRVAGSMTF